jgi:hypothetical protein
MGVRLKAAGAWLDVEQQEAKNNDTTDLDQMKRSELVEFVAARMLRVVNRLPERRLLDEGPALTVGDASLDE